MKFRDKLKFLFMLPVTWANRALYKTPPVMSDVETIDYIVKNKCGIARFGDGELDLMYGAGIKFQSGNKELKKRLREIAHACADDRVLICIPDILLSRKQLKAKFVPDDYNWWKKHLLATRGIWHKHFRLKQYGDATLTRFYVELLNKARAGEYVKKLKLIWENADIVFVEGERSRLGVGNDLFANAKSVRRIICPSKNAFEKYDKIFNTVLSKTDKTDLIICALGPTATVLAYDLSRNDRRALDFGHVDIEYEWFLMGAEEQVRVVGKDMGEAKEEFVESEEILLDNIIAKME